MIVRPVAFAIILAVAAPAAYAQSNSSRSSQSSASSSDDGGSKRSSNRSGNSGRHSEQDDARDALRQGKAMPLTAILEIAAKREPGTVLDAELDTDDGVLVYKLQILSDAGRKVRLRLNARTGEIIKVDYR